ncbi:MAG: type II toxin-antitoxin system PemK/MazF family toxin [Spirochaetae bacterium HGW-Spirochaetae-7]|jgi:mRNA interferase MazF|nr:MAG: type II toxin-antitoxin system PemK/MazF family toxin [Spirochaetae bacterium HGW-Spirochaetae-7]
MLDRYGVYWVNLDFVVGTEIAKTRPAVIISDDAMNRVLGTVVVCPVTSRVHQRWSSRVQTSVGGQVSEIAVDQIRTVDKSRIGAKLDQLDDIAAAAIRHIVTMMYGILSVE